MVLLGGLFGTFCVLFVFALIGLYFLEALFGRMGVGALPGPRFLLLMSAIEFALLGIFVLALGDIQQRQEGDFTQMWLILKQYINRWRKRERP